MNQRQQTIEKAMNIPGMFWPKEAYALLDLLADRESYLEIGSLCGRSLFIAGHALARRSRVVTIDPHQYGEAGWQEPFEGYVSGIHQGVSEFLQSYRAHEVQHHTCTLRESISRLTGQRFSAVFVDGDHRYQSVADDLQIVWRCVEDDGIMIGHDYWAGHPGVIQAVQEFSHREGVGYKLLADSRLWVMRKSGSLVNDQFL